MQAVLDKLKINTTLALDRQAALMTTAPAVRILSIMIVWVAQWVNITPSIVNSVGFKNTTVVGIIITIKSINAVFIRACTRAVAALPSILVHKLVHNNSK
jgi:hypothetical protein